MKYTAFSINNDPHDQPTPKLVWGKYIKDIDLRVDDEVFMVNDPGVNFFVKEVREKDILLHNPRNPSKEKVCMKFSPLFKKMGDIPMGQQEFFYHLCEVTGTTDLDGLFKPDDKYFVNYKKQFEKYFDLIRKTLHDKPTYYELTRLYERIIEEMGLGIFNEYIRSNFMSGSGDSVENLLHHAYEYGFEFYNGGSFIASMFHHAQRMDRESIFDNGVRAIVFGEGLKLDFNKI